MISTKVDVDRSRELPDWDHSKLQGTWDDEVDKTQPLDQTGTKSNETKSKQNSGNKSDSFLKPKSPRTNKRQNAKNPKKTSNLIAHSIQKSNERNKRKVVSPPQDQTKPKKQTNIQTPPNKFIGPKQTANSDDVDDFVDMTKYQQNQTKSFSDQDVTTMREGGSPFLFNLQNDSKDENDEGDGGEPYELSSRER